MNFNRRTPFILLLLSLSFLVSAQIPDGIWVAEGSRFSNKIREVRDPDFGITYLHYLFYPDRVCFGYNAFETAGCYSSATYSGDTIKLYGQPAYLLKRISEREIHMMRLQAGGSTVKLRRMSDFRMADQSGVIHAATETVHPIHIGPFVNLFFFNSLVIYPAPRTDQSIQVEFTVTANGFVQDIVILSRHSKLRRRWFISTLQGTSMQWIPAMVNGKPVSSRVSLEIIRTGYHTLDAEEKAARHYVRAAELITKREYASALLHLNDALVHAPGNPRYLYNQAVCFFYLKDERKQCQRLLQAREACPFIPTAMVDEQLGIMVECYRPAN